MKILIVCVIGLAVGGIAAGVATYFALAGKTNVWSLVHTVLKKQFRIEHAVVERTFKVWYDAANKFNKSVCIIGGFFVHNNFEIGSVRFKTQINRNTEHLIKFKKIVARYR